MNWLRKLVWGRHCFRCDKEREIMFCEFCVAEIQKTTGQSHERDGRGNAILELADFLSKNGHREAAIAVLKRESR